MKRFSLCLFALALFASSAAQALPAYHVKVNTRGLSGPALMDFTFLANAGATPANAILSNFRAGKHPKREQISHGESPVLKNY
ncbi:hypothetical protein [Massilia yuzhufengensis]|nr:hypothetical protein [Massilia yuzhufengensis]